MLSRATCANNNRDVYNTNQSPVTQTCLLKKDDAEGVPRIPRNDGYLTLDRSLEI